MSFPTHNLAYVDGRTEIYIIADLISKAQNNII